MREIRRKIVGNDVIVEDRIQKERETTNIKTQIIRREIYKAVVLECGHKIAWRSFGKVPANTTRCRQCENELKDVQS